MAKGKVYLIGAGPGDWELISVKGLRLIKEADVILYDFLASGELLRFAKPKAKVICVGKADGLHLFEQNKINALLFSYARKGKIVARLKGGDPLVFSRGIEEVLFLKKKGIEFEIVPGITSAFSAAESFGIPLTRRGKVQSIAVLTGRKSNHAPLDAPECDTLVYLMAVSTIQEVISRLRKAGREESEPCAFIERGTTPDERIVIGTLGNIVKKAKAYKVRSPAVFIVGKVVRYARKVYEYKIKNR